MVNIYKWPNNLGDSKSPYQDFIKFRAFTKKYEMKIDPRFDERRTPPNDRIEYDNNHIALPIPDSIDFSDGMKWSSEDSSAIAFNINAIKPLLEGKSINSDQIQGIARDTIPEFMLDNAAKLQKLGSRNAITQRTYNAILNPYTDQIFNGVELRSFTFNWKLVPRNKNEQFQIHNIIKLFRELSLPNTQDDFKVRDIEVDNTPNKPDSSQRWLSIPHYWQIDFYNITEPIKSIPKMKHCIISSINVNYTPDGQWSTHYIQNSDKNDELKGPVPVAYNLSINLSETEIVTSSDIGLGY